MLAVSCDNSGETEGRAADELVPLAGSADTAVIPVAKATNDMTDKMRGIPDIG